jgi:N-acetylmuramoyl-L-alanine amidase
MRRLVAAALALACSVPLAAGAQARVVIDPGHGGRQDGAMGPGGYLEKQFSLELARKLAAVLEKEAGAKVLLTRDRDLTLPLSDRVSAANQFRPDVMVSLHANSMPTRRMRATTRGIETFFLSLSASGEAARKTAERENDELAEAGEVQVKEMKEMKEKPAKDDTLAFILHDLQRAEAHADSSRLAYAIHQKLIAATRAEDRGVQQAPFSVLMGVEAPAVLLELGFLSHPEEGLRLKDPAYQDKLVRAIAEALKTFLAEARRREQRAQKGPP